MCRGDRRENIFEDDADRERFLSTLAEACQRTGWRIHAYVLMRNHYHWLLETPRANLVAGMRWFQTSYTIRYNLRHRKSGHLFQGRYKAVLVDPQGSYFASLADYIHLNPARAGVIPVGGKLHAYRWSSFRSYVAAAGARPPWLETTVVLGELGFQDRAAGRRRYAERLETRAKVIPDDGQLKVLRSGWLIGGEAFRDQVLDWLEQRSSMARRQLRREETDEDHGQRHAERLIAESLRALELEEEQLLELRKGDWRKRAIAHRVRSQTSVSLRWLAARLRMGSEGHLSRLAKSIADLTSLIRMERIPKATWKKCKKKGLTLCDPGARSTPAV